MLSEFMYDDMDRFLNELGKDLRKTYGRKVQFEIVIVGGAAIISRYKFRTMSSDIDAVFRSPEIKESARRVSEKYNFPDNFLNNDFMDTNSYTPNINRYSKYYKTFGGVLSVRMIEDEYLIAMKIMSGRKYKHDISDIVGILQESKVNGRKISLEDINIAMNNLYGGWNKADKEMEKIVKGIVNGNISVSYQNISEQETQNGDIVKRADNNGQIKKEKDIDNLISLSLSDIEKINHIPGKNQLISLSKREQKAEQIKEIEKTDIKTRESKVISKPVQH